MAVLGFSVLVAALTLLRRLTWFLVSFSILPLLFLIGISIFRLFVVTEFSFTSVIRSYVIFPAIMNFLAFPLFLLPNGYAFTVAQLLAVAWCVVAVFLIIRFAVNYSKFKKWVDSLPSVADTRLHNILYEIAGDSKYKSKIKILSDDTIETPMISGFFHPVIFYPKLDLDEEQIRYVLHHEWNHFVQKDSWYKLVVHLICCIMWWNPVVYLLKRDLEHTLELRCDLGIIADLSHEARKRYYDTIMDVYEHGVNRAPVNVSRFASGFAKTCGGALMKQRVNVGFSYDRKNISRRISSLFICAIILIPFAVSFLFIVQPYTRPTQATDEEQYRVNDMINTETDSYLIYNDDGTYSLYLDGEYTAQIKNPDDPILSSLPVVIK
jgi:Antirepressor regulating drug resistance, predicted signal transduction N-terminal membrane component